MKAKTFTEAQAANMIGIHPGTLAAWRRQGKVPSWRQLGRKVKYTPEDIERFIASKRRGQIDDSEGRVVEARFG